MTMMIDNPDFTRHRASRGISATAEFYVSICCWVTDGVVSSLSVAGSLWLWSTQHSVGVADARHTEASARWWAWDDGRHESSSRYESLQTGKSTYHVYRTWWISVLLSSRKVLVLEDPVGPVYQSLSLNLKSLSLSSSLSPWHQHWWIYAYVRHIWRDNHLSPLRPTHRWNITNLYYSKSVANKCHRRTEGM